MEKRSFLSFISALLLFASSPVAFAGEMNGQEFEKLIKYTQKNCPQLNCQNLSIRLTELTPQQIHNLAPRAQAQLKKSMEYVADIWPDSILEGGYESDFRFRLDRVQIISLAGTPIGLRFSFSAKANDEDHHQGRIVDNGFVSKDATKIFRDEKAMAQFIRSL